VGAAFRRLDTDRDGTLSWKEFEAGKLSEALYWPEKQFHTEDDIVVLSPSPPHDSSKHDSSKHDDVGNRSPTGRNEATEGGSTDDTKLKEKIQEKKARTLSEAELLREAADATEVAKKANEGIKLQKAEAVEAVEAVEDWDEDEEKEDENTSQEEIEAITPKLSSVEEIEAITPKLSSVEEIELTHNGANTPDSFGSIERNMSLDVALTAALQEEVEVRHQLEEEALRHELEAAYQELDETRAQLEAVKEEAIGLTEKVETTTCALESRQMEDKSREASRDEILDKLVQELGSEKDARIAAQTSLRIEREANAKLKTELVESRAAVADANEKHQSALKTSKERINNIHDKLVATQKYRSEAIETMSRLKEEKLEAEISLMKVEEKQNLERDAEKKKWIEMEEKDAGGQREIDRLIIEIKTERKLRENAEASTSSAHDEKLRVEAYVMKEKQNLNLAEEAAKVARFELENATRSAKLETEHLRRRADLENRNLRETLGAELKAERSMKEEALVESTRLMMEMTEIKETCEKETDILLEAMEMERVDAEQRLGDLQQKIVAGEAEVASAWRMKCAFTDISTWTVHAARGSKDNSEVQTLRSALAESEADKEFLRRDLLKSSRMMDVKREDDEHTSMYHAEESGEAASLRLSLQAVTMTLNEMAEQLEEEREQHDTELDMIEVEGLRRSCIARGTGLLASYSIAHHVSRIMRSLNRWRHAAWAQSKQRQEDRINREMTMKLEVARIQAIDKRASEAVKAAKDAERGRLEAIKDAHREREETKAIKIQLVMANANRAIRQLRAIMIQIMKGGVAQKFHVWRTQMLRWAAIRGVEINTSILEADIKAGQVAVATKRLQLVMAGIMQGEKQTLIQTMRLSMTDDRRREEREKLKQLKKQLRQMKEKAAGGLSIEEGDRQSPVTSSPVASLSSPVASLSSPVTSSPVASLSLNSAGKLSRTTYDDDQTGAASVKRRKEQRRVADDGRPYTASEFRQYYGGKARAVWDASQIYGAN